MSKPDREEVIKHLRACVLSSKGGIPLSTLSRDYHMLSGDPLPYRGLGYTKLDDFIRSVSDLKLINGPKGELIVQAISNEKGNHLARLVAMQSQSKNTRFIPKASRKSNETPQRKPWTRSTNWSPPNASNNNRSLRTPSLLRNMSQPTTSNTKPNAPLSRSHSTPGNKSSQKQTAENTGRVPNKNSTIPPLLSLECPVPSQLSQLGLRKPNNTFNDKRKLDNRNQKRMTGTNCNEIIYSPVVSPAASIRKTSVPTAEIKATEPIANLRKYVKENKLGDIEFKTIEMVTGTLKRYIASISIGKEFKVNTYPDGGSTTQEAMELAAILAYDTLQAKMCDATTALPATENTSEALKRILKLLEDHPNGVWANKVPDEYVKLYGEQLPPDWLQQTMESPQVDPNVISEKQIILVLSEGSNVASSSKNPYGASSQAISMAGPSSPEPSDCKVQPEMSGNSTANSSVASDDSIDSGIPPPLSLPKEENWDVYVTNANSTTDLWLRLVGDEYSSLYENLATEMELHYLESGPGKLEDVIEGHYYALELDDCVHRVQVATLEGEEGHCLLLDHGQVERVKISELRHLEQRFLTLPFQAVQCELRGLEEFGTAAEVQALLLEVVVGKTLVATPGQEMLGQPYTVGSPAVTLTLYDTSTEEDVDINQQLWRSITTNVLLPRLPQEGRVMEVMVSHITSGAYIYVQLHASILACLQDKISALQPDKLPQGSVKLPTKGFLYLAPFTDGCWYRAAFLETIDDKMVRVLFVDYGNDATVDKIRLLELEPLSLELSQIPNQAVLCRLHQLLPSADARVCERTVKRLAALLPADKPQLLKVVSAASASTPAAVELFRRLQPDNLLVSLNSTLALDPDLFEVPDSKVENIRRGSHEKIQEKDKVKAQEKDQKADGLVEAVLHGLSQPKIPEIGGFLDVNVTLAASPYNFVVQPWEQGLQLEQLMVALQSLYGAGGPHLQPLASSEVQEGGIYAALYEDGKWYRVQVNNILKGDSVTVYVVDYGDHFVLSVDKLRPLAAKFCKLPYQAIKAKLSGVCPKHSDWSAEDCVRFQELVRNRQFVSVVEETGPDLINPSDTVLGLRLIDTSNEEMDVDIGKLLVEENRANFTK